MFINLTARGLHVRNEVAVSVLSDAVIIIKLLL